VQWPGRRESEGGSVREEMWALGVAGGWGEKGEWLVFGAGNGDWGRE
jgi:hypothetical protein